MYGKSERAYSKSLRVMHKKEHIFQKMRKISRGVILVDEPMSRHTSYKIGGPADFFFRPLDYEDVTAVIDFCNREGIPRFIIGNGTNILVSDDGLRGIVMDVSKAFKNISCKGNVVTVGSGVTLNKLIEYCTEMGLAGLEALTGIPGQTGGALMLNAGAFGVEMMDRVVQVKLINQDGVSEILNRNQIEAEYRKTHFPENAVLSEAQIMFEEGNPQAMKSFQDNIVRQRRQKQPLSLPSAGSVFKRPPNDYAGRLIEEAGCKGLRIGDAMVSRKHANFIVNSHLATAQDVLRLIEEVRAKVYKRFQIHLEIEIHLLGFGSI